jgi:acyl-[acyl carrier protein]--UDP-N-acetylglucosamine O-acyltransferase
MSDYFVHESSYIDDNVVVGEGTKIWHFCHVQSMVVMDRRAEALVLAIYKSAAEGQAVRLPLKRCSTMEFKGRF